MEETVVQKVNRIMGITESYKAPERLMEILFDKERREDAFRQFLEAFDYDVGFDWFHEYFQEEHADRKTKKQDFTPQSLSQLVTQLVGSPESGLHYEPCAGTGGMTITRWNYDRMQHSPFDYRPSWYVYNCEELSDRAVPFLLFNLAIRGMNAVVVHCDVLTRKAYGAFFVQNEKDDHLQFSSINVMPYSEQVARHLAIEWVEERYEGHVESSEEMPAHIVNPVPRGEVSDFTKAVYAICGSVTEGDE